MWIALRLLTLIGVYLVRWFWRGRKPAGMREFEGVPLAFRDTKNKRGEITRVWFGVAYPQPIAFRLSRESAIDRWFKFVGLASEQQSGEAEFDRRVYVACDHFAFGRLLRQSAPARAAVLALFDYQAVRSIFSDGAYLWVESGQMPDEIERRQLLQLHAALALIPARAAERTDGFFFKVLAIEAGVASCCTRARSAYPGSSRSTLRERAADPSATIAASCSKR